MPNLYCIKQRNPALLLTLGIQELLFEPTTLWFRHLLPPLPKQVCTGQMRSYNAVTDEDVRNMRRPVPVALMLRGLLGAFHNAGYMFDDDVGEIVDDDDDESDYVENVD